MPSSGERPGTLTNRAAPRRELSALAHPRAKLRNSRFQSCLHIWKDRDADIDLPYFLPSSSTILCNQHTVPQFHHTNNTYRCLVYLPALPFILLSWPLGFGVIHHSLWKDLDYSHDIAQVFISGACSSEGCSNALNWALQTYPAQSLSLFCLHHIFRLFCGHMANTAILLLSLEFRPSPPTQTIFLDHKHRWSRYTGESLVTHCHQRITAHFIAGLGCAFTQIIWVASSVYLVTTSEWVWGSKDGSQGLTDTRLYHLCSGTELHHQLWCQRWWEIPFHSVFLSRVQRRDSLATNSLLMVL